MMNETTRIFLEDWFSAHPEDADAFGGDALDRLPDLVAAAMEAAPDGGPAEVLPDDVRVTALLTNFRGVVSSRVREKTDGANSVDGMHMSEEELAPFRRVIAAALTLEDRRRALKKGLAATQVSVSSVSRQTGMARSSLSPKKAPAMSCLVDYMKEHADEQEGRRHSEPQEKDMEKRLETLAEELNKLKRRLMENDAWEVKCRNQQAEVEHLRADLKTHMDLERKSADRYVRLREICRARGIDVPAELDEDERIDAAAAAYRAMLSGQNYAS